MDDFTRLQQKLAKLRQQDHGSGRALRGAPERLLAGIVTELDETILPRRVSFVGDGCVQLHFAMANRRLQALLDPTPVAEGAARLSGVALKDVEDPNLAALREVLDKVLARTEVLSITTARQTGAGFPSDIGVPAAQLRRAWDIADPGSDQADAGEALKAFLEQAGKTATAWLRIEGEDVVGQHGDAATLSRISDGAAVFLDGYLSRREQVFQRGIEPVALALGAVNGKAVLFIQAGTAMAFVESTRDEIAGLVKAWQALIAI